MDADSYGQMLTCLAEASQIELGGISTLMFGSWTLTTEDEMEIIDTSALLDLVEVSKNLVTLQIADQDALAYPLKEQLLLFSLQLLNASAQVTSFNFYGNRLTSEETFVSVEGVLNSNDLLTIESINWSQATWDLSRENSDTCTELAKLIDQADALGDLVIDNQLGDLTIHVTVVLASGEDAQDGTITVQNAQSGEQIY